MTEILVLGGTGWLSGRIARRWRDAGAAVTCLARGGRPVPDGTRLVVGDRDSASAYESLADREWDEVVDISSTAAHVRAAVDALGGRARHWTYVSSVSAYADDDVVGADETAPLAPPAGPGEEGDYRREKSAAEAAVRAACGHRAAVVRPGLIVGPGDPTDRFGYWVARFAAAGAEPVLVPDVPAAPVQVIDVDDLASFVVALGGARFTGAVNAVGDALPLDAVLTAARATAGHTGEVVAASPDWLVAQGWPTGRGSARCRSGCRRACPGSRRDRTRSSICSAGGSRRSARRWSVCSPTSAPADSIARAGPASPAPTSARCSPPARAAEADLRRTPSARYGRRMHPAAPLTVTTVRRARRRQAGRRL